MASANGETGTAAPRPVSALPSVQARAVAFGAIVVGGVCGGLIGFSTVKVGCQGSCSTPEGVGGMIGAIVAAAGVAVIAVLVLRAMGEWRSIKQKRDLELMIAAAGAALSSVADPGEAVGDDPTADPDDDPPDPGPPAARSPAG